MSVSGGQAKALRRTSAEAQVDFSPELRFLVSCCRACFVGAASHPLSLPRGLDWERVVRLARFHRVQGLAWKAISSADIAIPSEISAGLMGDAMAIAAANLQAARQCQALLAESKGANLPVVFLKGLALGVLAYGSPGLKAGVDVDLLVAAEHIQRAGDLLETQGYCLIVPKENSRSLSQWHRVRKESLWFEPRSGLYLDLHTSVADNPKLIPTIGVASPTRDVDIGNGIALPTLQVSENFAYLAVHGASSAWFRLKWISDFTALLAGLSPQELEQLYRRSQQLCAGRAPAQALLLSHQLFGTLADSPALKAELLSHSANRLLYRAALTQLTGRSEPIEPTSRPLGTARIHWTQFLLLPGIGFKASEFVRQAKAALV